MLTCFLNRKKLSAFLDNELPEDRREKIVAHVRNCSGCRTYLESMRSDNRLLAQYLNLRRSFIPKDPQLDTSILSNRELNSEASAGIKSVSGLQGEFVSFFKRLSTGVWSGRDVIDTDTVSPEGVITRNLIVRIVHALLIALAFLLLYAPKVNTTVV